MIVIPGTSFYDDFERIRDKKIIRRAMSVIEKLEVANSLREISNIKSMQGHSGFYRIRFGDFRIGFRLVDETTIKLLAIEHRSVFYRCFP
jgi:mRNA interferase RelE/StbE